MHEVVTLGVLSYHKDCSRGQVRVQGRWPPGGRGVDFDRFDMEELGGSRDLYDFVSANGVWNSWRG